VQRRGLSIWVSHHTRIDIDTSSKEFEGDLIARAVLNRSNSMFSRGYGSLILGGVLFNILTEFWVHGLVGFLNPVLTISLLVLYATYFLMLEDLVVRFGFGSTQVLITGIIFGLWHETFTTGSSFGGLLGLDPIILVIANVFWWGIMQSVMGLYFANRFLGPRNVDHRRLGPIAWALCLLFSLSAASNFMKYEDASHLAYVVIFILIGVMFTLVGLLQRSKERRPFEQMRFLDRLLYIHLALCIGIGFTVGSISNTATTIGFVIWSLIFGTFIIGYRFGRGSIPV
jgi:hypothetical protein